MRIGALIVFLAGLALAETPYALTSWQGALWLGGEDAGRPYIKRYGAAQPAWRGEAPGRVLALAPGYAAGSLAEDAALFVLDAKGQPIRSITAGGKLKEEAKALALFGGRVYLAGDAEGGFFGKNQGGQDVFIAWVEGDELVGTLLGTSDDDYLTALAAGEDGLFLAGYHQVNEDCIRVAERGFVFKLDGAGKVQPVFWFGYEASSRPTALLYREGALWVAGQTDGPLFGEHRGGDDVFVLKLSPSGEVLYATQWGSELSDLVSKLVAHEGRLYLVGSVAKGGYRPFVARLDEKGRPVAKVTLPQRGVVKDAAVFAGKLYLLTTTGVYPAPWP